MGEAKRRIYLSCGVKLSRKYNIARINGNMSTDKNLEDILKVATKLRLLLPKFSSALIASTRGVQKFLEDGVSTVDEEDDQLIMYEKELAIKYFHQGDAEKLIDQME